MTEWNGDFSFGFNESKFSDRVLHIHICTESLESTESPSVERVITLQINSLILAGRSPFFYKLFSNGMNESQQREVILRINSSEEAAFLELLNFMYSNNLRVTTAHGVLDVLVVANKFDVASCMVYCGRLLKNLPLTPETVLVYLDLPSTILMAEEFQPLTVAAKQFYAVHYKDITRFEDEILNLPLASVEAIISSDDLQAYTEDDVYMFVMKWVRAKYDKRKDRCEIIRTRIAQHIRYCYMTYQKIIEMRTCEEFDRGFVRKVFHEHSFFQIEKGGLITRQYPNLNHKILERPNIRIVKTDDSDQEPDELVVYMDLKHDVCASLFPLGSVRSEAFNLGEDVFYVAAQCRSRTRNMIEEKCFRLAMGMQEEVVVSVAVEYEFAIRSKGGEGFVTKLKGSISVPRTVNFTLLEISMVTTPWEKFIQKDGDYFIDDVLHLRLSLVCNY